MNRDETMSERTPSPRRKITAWYARYTYNHVVIFLLTFFGYALFHATRKTFSNIKTTISDEWRATCDSDNNTCVTLKPDNLWNKRRLFDTDDEAKVFLGALDATFLGAYSIGLFISGILGDRFDLRIVLSLGMTISAATMFMFGVLSEWLEIYNKGWYIVFWILNGFAQSTGWPAVVAVMGNWFKKSGRGLIFGIWSACASVGNIIGALLVSAVLKYGYHYAILVTSSTLFAGGLVIFFGLVPSPSDMDIDEKEDDDFDDVAEPTIDVEQPLLPHASSISDSAHHQHKPIGFLQAVMLPGVIMYSLCYACLKMVNYSFLFWLPFYLSNKFGWAESVADEISIWYDVGGIIGGILGGYVSDLMRKRSPVIFFLLTLAVPSLWLFKASSDTKLSNAILMTITGFFVGGAANIISAAITADLGQQDALQGNNEALATVTGIVDGTGSVGAAVGQLLVPLIQSAMGWKFVFYFFIVLCILTNVCIVPLFVREMRDLIRSAMHKWAMYRQKRRVSSAYAEIRNANDLNGDQAEKND